MLLLGAHIGSFEVLRALSERRPELQTRILMDRQQTPELTRMLMALNPAVAASIIDVGVNDTDIALAIQDAAKQSALIGMLADRSRPKETTTMVPFFGAPAPFPVAPYLIASLLDLPVVLTFGAVPWRQPLRSILRDTGRTHRHPAPRARDADAPVGGALRGAAGTSHAAGSLQLVQLL